MRSEKKPVGQLTRAQLLIPPLMNSKSRMSHFYLSGLVSLLIKINNLFFFFFFFLFLFTYFTVMFCRLINEVFFCETRQKDVGPGNSLQVMLLKKCILSGVTQQRGQRFNLLLCSLRALYYCFPPSNFPFF